MGEQSPANEAWLAWGLGEMLYWMVFGATAFVSRADTTVQLFEALLAADYPLDKPLRESDLDMLGPIISGTLVARRQMEPGAASLGL
jgi:hypothetical protein